MEPVEAPECSLSKTVDSVIKEMESASISNQEQYTWMEEWLRRNKSTQKVVTDFFEPARVAAKAEYDAVLERKGAFIKPLEAAEKVARAKMSAFATERERERREAQRVADEEAQRLRDSQTLSKAEELEAMGRTDKAEEVLSRAPVARAAPVAPKVGKTMEVWTAEVVDMQAFLSEASGLPRVADCVSVNVTKLAALLKEWRDPATGSPAHVPAGVNVRVEHRPVL